MPAMCRDCARSFETAPRCPHCGGTRIADHPELLDLTLAHIDADAFYASVEKRDRPELADRPVVVGGGRRGVVAAACYVARRFGIRSAMPMAEARRRCPGLVEIRPDPAKYTRAGRQVRELMRGVTPLVEPLSIDEAFLDLAGTAEVHRAAPAQVLARLVRVIEGEVGVTASVGLSYNKFLAKIASDLDKPRGFAVIGRAEAPDFLEGQPVGILWGVGPRLGARLASDGLRTLADLRGLGEAALVSRYGTIGRRLARFAWGEDDRPVTPEHEAKSLSAEVTFDEDIAEAGALRRVLWHLSEKVSRRLKLADLGGGTVVLKLKTHRFKLLTRSRRLPAPTQLADELYRTALPLLETEVDGRRFRLLGIGAGDLVAARLADPPDLIDSGKEKRRRVETAIDAVREKFGAEAIGKGRGLEEPEPVTPPKDGS